MRGVAVCGRATCRHHDPATVLEITRVCTDGARNACSFLYGACARAAKALGFARVLTYTEEGEDGASLLAAGFVLVAETDGERSWSSSSRPRPEQAVMFDLPRRAKVARQRWEKPCLSA